MDKLIQKGKVEGGKLRLSTPVNYNRLIAHFEGKDVALEIKECKDDKLPRSVRQNAYLWGVVYSMIAEHTGHSPKDMHAYFSSKFLTEVIVVADQTVVVTKSTTALKTSEFNEYIEKVKKLACVQFDAFEFPDPNEE